MPSIVNSPEPGYVVAGGHVLSRIHSIGEFYLMFHRTRTAALAAAAVLALGAPALAAGQGNPHATPPGQSNPAQPGAGTLNNPNGMPPIGQPSPGTASTRGNQLGRPSPVPSSAASATPSTAPSAVPSVVPSVIPSVVPSTLPSTLPVSTRAALRGTLTSLTGTKAIVKLANGTLQTYTVSTKTAAMLKHRVGKNVAFRVLNGALTLGSK